MRRAAVTCVYLGMAAVTLAFLAFPIAAIFAHTSPGKLLEQLSNPVVRDAFEVSLKTSLIAQALILLFGTPTAYLLATNRFPGHAFAVTLVELPLVLPPAVAGIALLAALGPEGILGGVFWNSLALQTSAVVVALTFVAAPFYIRQAQTAFQAVDRSLLDASRTLGSGEGLTFLRVAIPVAVPGLAAGLALAWGRALGEFGATLMFAGNFQGITQTAPLAIYDQFATDFPAALGLSAVLVAASAALLLVVKLIPGSTTLGGA